MGNPLMCVCICTSYGRRICRFRCVSECICVLLGCACVCAKRFDLRRLVGVCKQNWRVCVQWLLIFQLQLQNTHEIVRRSCLCVLICSCNCLANYLSNRSECDSFLAFMNGNLIWFFFSNFFFSPWNQWNAYRIYVTNGKKGQYSVTLSENGCFQFSNSIVNLHFNSQSIYELTWFFNWFNFF